MEREHFAWVSGTTIFFFFNSELAFRLRES